MTLWYDIKLSCLGYLNIFYTIASAYGLRFAKDLLRVNDNKDICVVG